MGSTVPFNVSSKMGSSICIHAARPACQRRSPDAITGHPPDSLHPILPIHSAKDVLPLEVYDVIKNIASLKCFLPCAHPTTYRTLVCQTTLFWYPCEISGEYILVVVDIPVSYVGFTELSFKLGVSNPAGIVAKV